MKKKLLAILGGPHAHGATAAMLGCAVQAAEAAGWEVTTVPLYRKQLAFCQGCRACVPTGECVLQDDLQEIAALLRTCDRVVLAAPTYWANVPAAVKNLFDRLLGTAMEDTAAFPRPRLSADQEYLLLTACNTPFPFSWLCGQSRGAQRAMREFFKTAGMRCCGQITFAGAKGGSKLPPRIRRRIERRFRKQKSD